MTWWLREDWFRAECRCGVNIWDSGGDPDWGECYDCSVSRRSAYDYDYPPYPEPEPEPEQPVEKEPSQEEQQSSEKGQKT